jgi:hypothetical protein
MIDQHHVLESASEVVTSNNSILPCTETELSDICLPPEVPKCSVDEKIAVMNFARYGTSVLVRVVESINDHSSDHSNDINKSSDPGRSVTSSSSTNCNSNKSSSSSGSMVNISSSGSNGSSNTNNSSSSSSSSSSSIDVAKEDQQTYTWKTARVCQIYADNVAVRFPGGIQLKIPWSSRNVKLYKRPTDPSTNIYQTIGVEENSTTDDMMNNNSSSSTFNGLMLEKSRSKSAAMDFLMQNSDTSDSDSGSDNDYNDFPSMSTKKKTGAENLNVLCEKTETQFFSEYSVLSELEEVESSGADEGGLGFAGSAAILGLESLLMQLDGEEKEEGQPTLGSLHGVANRLGANLSAAEKQKKGLDRGSESSKKRKLTNLEVQDDLQRHPTSDTDTDAEINLEHDLKDKEREEEDIDSKGEKEEADWRKEDEDRYFRLILQK